jgi:NADH-quinone oxidoreductase subunit G
MPGSLYPFFWAPSWNSVQALNKFQEEIAGPLRGGDPGVRLVDGTRPGSVGAYATAIPRPFSRRESEWLIVPQYRIFGSDELSSLSPAVAERISCPTLALNSEDAATLAVTEGERLDLTLDGVTFQVPAQLRAALPRGVASLTIVSPRFASLALPAWGKVSRSEKTRGES